MFGAGIVGVIIVREQNGIEQQQRCESVGHVGRGEHGRVTAHRMTDGERTAKADHSDDFGQILAEASPAIRERRLRAAAVPAHVDREAASIGNARDDLVPAARVKSSGVAEENRGIAAGALPQREIHIVGADELGPSDHLVAAKRIAPPSAASAQVSGSRTANQTGSSSISPRQHRIHMRVIQYSMIGKSSHTSHGRVYRIRM